MCWKNFVRFAQGKIKKWALNEKKQTHVNKNQQPAYNIKNRRF